MKNNFSNKLFAIAFILISLLGVSTIYIFNKLNEANDLIDHTYEVQKQLQLVEREFLVTVAAQRSLLLTADPVYKNYYDNARLRMYASVDSLKKFVWDNEYQRNNCDTLKLFLIKRDSAFIAETRYLDSNTIDNKERNEEILQNLYLSQEIVRVFRSMQNEEGRLIHLRKESELKNKSIVPILIILITLGAMAILIQAVYFLNKELKARKRALEKTNVLVSELNQSNIELERFAYVASHDLQEPLRKIRIFSERLTTSFQEKFAESEPTLTKYLNRIESSAQTMSQLVTDLLEYSKLQGVTPKSENLNLAHLIGNKISEVLAGTNVKYVFNNMVKDSPMTEVIPSQIDQLLQNLVDNAVKYRDKNKQKLVLDLTYDKIENDEEFYKFSFKDNGIGFEAKYADKIFDVFTRLVNKHEITGTGMGLSICKQIMQNHGGRIEAESIPEVGTTFHLYFPA